MAEPDQHLQPSLMGLSLNRAPGPWGQMEAPGEASGGLLGLISALALWEMRYSNAIPQQTAA